MMELGEFRRLFPEYNDRSDEELQRAIQGLTPQQMQEVERRRTAAGGGGGADPLAGAPMLGGPVLSDQDWFRQTFGRDPIADDPTRFDPANPPDDVYRLRQQQDPQGQQAYFASVTGPMRPDTPAMIDPTTPEGRERFPPQNTLGQWGLAALNGASLGLGNNFMDLFGAGDQMRTRLDEFRQVNPGGAALAEGAGGLATAFAPLGMVARGGSLLGQMGRGALAGAAEGGLYGGGNNDQGNFIEGAVPGAGVGGTVGALIPPVARGVARVASPLARSTTPAPAAIPTTAELRAFGHAAYDQARAAGLVVSADAYDDFMLNLLPRLEAEGFDEGLHPRAAAALNRLLSSANMQPRTLDELNILRRVIGGAAQSLEPDERRIASIIRDDLDDWLANLDPKDIVAGDPDAALAALTEARATWRRLRNAETLDQIQEVALNRVGANYTQAGLETALRQQFRALADRIVRDPREAARWTTEEQAAITSIVRGGPLQNALRRLGAFAPRGAISQMFGLAGAAMGNIPMVAASIAGEGARRASSGIASGRVADLNALVRTGANAPALPMDPLLGLMQGMNLYGAPRVTEEYIPRLPLFSTP